MHWYWTGLIAGALAPLIVFSRSILSAVQRDGIGTGLVVWAGACGVTIPIAMLVLWLVNAMVG